MAIDKAKYHIPTGNEFRSRRQVPKKKRKAKANGSKRQKESGD